MHEGEHKHDGAHGPIRWLPPLFFAACLALFLAGAWLRLPIQNVYENYTFDYLVGMDLSNLRGAIADAYSQSYYPPLYPTLSILAGSWVGIRYDALAAVFLIVPVIAALLLVLHFRQRRRTAWGWCVAGVFLCLPITWRIAISPYVDTLMTPLLVGVFVVLHTSSRRTRPVLDVALGVLLGLGMLVKWTFAVLAGPWALASFVLWLVRFGPGRWMRAAARAAFIGLPAIAVCGHWYATQLRWDVLLGTVSNDPTGLAPGIGHAAVFQFCLLQQMLVGEGAPWPVSLCGLIGLVLLVAPWSADRWRDHVDGVLFFLCAVFAPLAFFAVGAHNELRYSIPASASLLALFAYTENALPKRILAIVLLGYLSVVSVAYSVVPELRAAIAIRGASTAADVRWYDPAIARFDTALRQAVTAHPDTRNREFGVHPLYHPLTANDQMMRWVLRSAGIEQRRFMIPFYFAEWADDLRANRNLPPYLLTDCGDAETCDALHAGFHRDVAGRTLDGFVSQLDGKRFRPVGDVAPGDDISWIRQRYDVLERVRAGDREIWLWMLTPTAPQTERPDDR